VGERFFFLFFFLADAWLEHKAEWTHHGRSRNDKSAESRRLLPGAAGCSADAGTNQGCGYLPLPLAATLSAGVWLAYYA